MNTQPDIHTFATINTVGSGQYGTESIQVDNSRKYSAGRNDAIGEQLGRLHSDAIRLSGKHDLVAAIDTDMYSPENIRKLEDIDLKMMEDVEINPAKSVRFLEDRKGKVHCEAFRNRSPRTKEERFNCWYTPIDFKNFRRDCKAEAYVQQRTPYTKNFAAVYQACTKGSFRGVTKERAYISAASCRGLEVVVYPILHQNRKNALVTVLKTQASLPYDMSESMRVDAIASASRFLTKQSRQLARVLGSGDAAVVVANNRMEASREQEVPQLYTTKTSQKSS